MAWASAAHGRALEAPSVALHASTNTVLVVEVLRVEPPTALVVRPIATLSGEAPPDDELTLATPPEALAAVAPGARYVVGYTAWTVDPRRPRMPMRIPEGPRLLVSPGLEPALFRDTPKARERLAATPDPETGRSPAYLAEVLDGLADVDPQWQRYYAAELALRPRLAATLDDAGRRRVAAFLADPDAPASARRLLLGVAARQPGSYGSSTATDVARAVLRTLPVAVGAMTDSDYAGLAYEAFSVLDQLKVGLEPDIAARWIACAHPPLAEVALLAIRREAPARERELAEAALAQSLLPAPTREFLHDHLRRLALMEAALQRQNDSAAR